MKKIILGETVAVITWEDSWGNGDYCTIPEMAETGPYIIDLAGIVIRNDKKGMAVAAEILPPLVNGEKRFRTVQFVPRAMIRKVKVL